MVRFSDSGGGEQRESLAPVIPLFGSTGAGEDRAVRGATPSGEPSWNATWADDPDDDAGHGEAVGIGRGREADGESERESAEKSLLKKLRARSLSVAEARAVVSERDLDRDTVDAVLQAFLDRGYLDDAALAEQVVHVGVDRKGQGRRVIAQTLAKRGIPREIADAALAALPDDDADRALEYARTKARGMRDLDRDAALRRLSGQLARRGYGGSVALDAARRALDEVGSSSGVRFR